MVKYSYYIARISSFIASKMQSSMSKNMVFPSCGDIKIVQLLVSFCLFRCFPTLVKHKLCDYNSAVMTCRPHGYSCLTAALR